MKSVENFNRKILGIERNSPQIVDRDEFDLSVHQLREEIKELVDAYETGDLVQIIDALIDIDYFLHGIIYKFGISSRVYKRLFNVVHECNMSKKVGVKKGREGFNGALDAVKPDGWVSPEETIDRLMGRWYGRDYADKLKADVSGRTERDI